MTDYAYTWLNLLLFVFYAALCGFVYARVVRNPYATRTGKFIAAIGGLLLIGSGPELVLAFININLLIAQSPPISLVTPTHLSFIHAVVLFLLGALTVWFGVGSWRFTRPDMREKRRADIAARKREEEGRRQFNLFGQLVSIRTTVVRSGLLSGTERFTEIETTAGVLVVNGEVGSVSKGIPVYRNGYHRVLLGGGPNSPDKREFMLREV